MLFIPKLMVKRNLLIEIWESFFDVLFLTTLVRIFVLPMAEFAYNISVNRSSGVSLFEELLEVVRALLLTFLPASFGVIKC